MIKFSVFYEQTINQIICEGLDAAFLRQKHAEAKVVFKDINTAQKKNKLKKLSKELMLHILNANFKKLLNKYFPNLVNVAGKYPDNVFKDYLNKELSQTGMTSAEYNMLLKDIDDAIYDLSNRNHQALNGLFNLRPNYLLQYKG